MITAVAVPVAAVVGVIWAATRDLSRYPGPPDRAGAQGHRPRTGRPRAAHRQARQRARDGGRRRDALPMRAGGRARARPRAHAHPVPRSVRRCSWARSRSAGSCSRAPTSWSSATTWATPTSRCCRRPTARGRIPARTARCGCAPRAAFPWINTIEVRDSVLTVSEGAGRPPVVLEIPNAHLEVAGAQPDAAGRGTVRRAAGDADGPHGHGRLVQRLDGRACPATSTCRAVSAAARSRSRAASTPRARRCRSTREGPDVSVFGPYIRLPVPAGGPYVDERQGRDPAQRLQGRGHGAEGRLRAKRRARRCSASTARARRPSS